MLFFQNFGNLIHISSTSGIIDSYDLPKSKLAKLKDVGQEGLKIKNNDPFITCMQVCPDILACMQAYPGGNTKRGERVYKHIEIYTNKLKSKALVNHCS